jgi:flagella basal body P-ring formation protein FlgA
VPRRSIRAGDPVTANALEAPPAVARGDLVSVEVSSGAAQLKLTAKAESAGRPGDVILLRNPGNGQRFQARVSHPGKVTIDAKQTTLLGGARPAGNRRRSR